MPDERVTSWNIYSRAWWNLRKRVAATRSRRVSKDEIVGWMLVALEQAITERGQQEKA